MPRRGTKSKTNPAFAILILIIGIIGGIYALLPGNDSGGISSTVTETATAAVETDVSPVVTIPATGTSWWEVYFTDPLTIKNPQDWQRSVAGQLVDKIYSAQSSIHIASFEFDLTPVAEALIAAKQRGVDVRWVTDDEFGLEADEEPGRGQFAMLRQAGIEVRSDSRSALMHNKFWIFDGQSVWTGSTNITRSGIFDQNNNAIVIHSPEVAAIYEREFQEMWNGQFGPRSPSQLNDQAVVVEGSQIAIVFTPEDPGLENAIIPIVASANQSIRFLTFVFTDYPLADAMSQRAAAGVDVAGVFETVGSETEASELRTLLCRNVPVRQDGNPRFMHNKVIVIDERIVITGSMNYSTNAEVSNDENIIIIDNADIARLYLQEFERIWELAREPDLREFACG